MVGKNNYALKNSAKMVENLSTLKLDDTNVLVSFDVKALFTKVPVDKTLELILDKLENDDTLPSWAWVHRFSCRALKRGTY